MASTTKQPADWLLPKAEEDINRAAVEAQGLCGTLRVARQPQDDWCFIEIKPEGNWKRLSNDQAVEWAADNGKAYHVHLTE